MLFTNKSIFMNLTRKISAMSNSIYNYVCCFRVVVVICRRTEMSGTPSAVGSCHAFPTIPALSTTSSRYTAALVIV